MLLAIMTIYYNLGSTDLQLISLSEISLESQKWLCCHSPSVRENMTSRIIYKNKNTLNLFRKIS